MMRAVGAVVIGRNEGERLGRCLESILPHALRTVYVDSGSTDDSAAMAREMGAEVVELDPARPFTAARARNEGMERLLQLQPELELVQFVDGDCEVIGDWWEKAVEAIAVDEKIAIVCGRRRERSPEASIYNRLVDVEWNTPVGEAQSCGGDFLARVTALRSVNGFDPRIIAGEEPEMCLRLRRGGWKILRLDAEMTLHDVNLRRFGQWWKRVLRGGWAYAEGAHRYGRDAERYRVRESRSNWFWGMGLPVATALLAWPTKGLSLLLLAGYPVLAWRIHANARRRGLAGIEARAYALFCTIGKFAQVVGQAQFVCTRLARRQGRIIEYK